MELVGSVNEEMTVETHLLLQLQLQNLDSCLPTSQLHALN